VKSCTKASLTDDQVRALVADALDVDVEREAVVTELTDGMFNAVYSIALTRHREPVVLKVSAGPDARLLTYEKDIMETEVAMLSALDEHTDVPVPRILASDLSRTKVANQYFLMSSVAGRSLRASKRALGKDGRRAVAGDLGRILAQTHAVRGTRFGYPGWGEDGLQTSWSAAFARMVDDILQDAARHDVRLPADRIRHAVARNEDLLDAVDEPRLVNFDMWPGNVFVRTDAGTPRVSGVIDLERSFWGDPLADFVGMNPGKAKPFEDADVWAAYAAGRPGEVSPSGPTAGDERRGALYRLYMLLLLATETYRYRAAHRIVQREAARLWLHSALKGIEAKAG
jgi:aminoglycoside phosphotransferase (APT) family kinase protein